MMHGHPPFVDRNINAMFEKIKVHEPQFSQDISDDAKDCIKKVNKILLFLY